MSAYHQSVDLSMKIVLSHNLLMCCERSTNETFDLSIKTDELKQQNSQCYVLHPWVQLWSKYTLYKKLKTTRIEKHICDLARICGSYNTHLFIIFLFIHKQQITWGFTNIWFISLAVATPKQHRPFFHVLLFLFIYYKYLLGMHISDIVS